MKHLNLSSLLPGAGRQFTHQVSRGDDCSAKADWRGAADHYERALAINPKVTAIWVRLGHALRESDDLVGAECAYRKAIERDADDRDARFFLAVTLRRKGDQVEAVSLLWNLVSRRLDDRAAKELAALAQISSGVEEFVDAVEDIFDVDYYIKSNTDVRRAAIPALAHYVIWGWREDRGPSKFFDPKFYKRKYRRRLPSTMPAIVHYWKVGRTLGLLGNPVGSNFWYTPAAPDAASWATVSPAKKDASTRAVVIMPVYKGLEETLAAIYHCLESRGASAYSLLVINDCGPDQGLNDELSRLAGLDLFDYVVNSTNRGFVQTCNKGILNLSGDLDVVLLNSDAFVFPGWFDRMIAHADRDPNIATVTPLSNNATLCSYPLNDADNFRSLELTPAELDVLAGETNAGIAVEVPTGVGFCFYMRRSVIDEIGALDHTAFRLGYGEENDFCMRAFEAGHKNVLAADIFVFHVGSVSFSEVKDENYNAGQLALAFKHPNYTLLTRQHMKADPAHHARMRLDRARLERVLKGAVIFVTHNWGGGIDTYLDRMREELDAAGRMHLTLIARDRNFLVIEVCDRAALFVPNLATIDLRMDRDFVLELLQALDPSLIHVNSLAGLDWCHHAEMLKIIMSCGAPYRFILHDYSAISSIYNLVRPDGIYVGLPDPGELAEWPRMASDGAFDRCPLELRRSMYHMFLSKAETIEFPSAAARDVFSHYYPDLLGEVVRHTDPFSTDKRAARPPRNGRIRIASIGAIGPHKGSNLLVALARDSAARKLGLDYCVVGYTDQDEAMEAAGVTITGAYNSDAEAIDLLLEQQPDLVFISSVWPETYCYTLSFALSLGIPVAVFDIGAQAERAAEVSWSVRLDPRLINAPAKLSGVLMEIDIDRLWKDATSANLRGSTSTTPL